MNKRILSLLLILCLLATSLVFSVSPPAAQAAFPPVPPKGWVLASTFQRVPLTLDSTPYYAYLLKKSTATTAAGWLIVNANGTAVTRRDTYGKLALTATVSTAVQDPAFLPQMKNELEVLRGIRWRIDLYETATGLTKLATDLTTVLRGVPSYGGLEDLAATMITPATLTEGNRAHDVLWPLFTKGLINDLSSPLVKGIGLVGSTSVDSDEQWLKIFGIVGTVLRKTVAAFAQGGATTYQAAYDLANRPRSSWSYEEASMFLTKYEEGRTHGLPFATWYLTLIPHEGGFFGTMENIGDMWWENIIQEAVGTTAVTATVDGAKLAGDLVKKVLDNTLVTGGIAADIQSASAPFALYRLIYDPALAGSLADQICSAVVSVATTTDKTMYAAGDLVAAVDVLRVRDHASLTATTKGSVPKGTTGSIIGASVVADGYRWWPVRWSSGLTGWSVGTLLKKTAAREAPSIAKVELSMPSNGSAKARGSIAFFWFAVPRATRYEFVLYNHYGQVALDTTVSKTAIQVSLGIVEVVTWKVRAGTSDGKWGDWSSTWRLVVSDG